MRLKALLGQQQALKSEFKAWLDKVVEAATTEGRGLSEEEQARQTDYQAKLANLDSLIQAARASEALAAGPATPATEPVLDAGPVTPRIEVGAGPIEKDPWCGFAGPHAYANLAIATRNACAAGGAIDRRLVEGGLFGAPTNSMSSSGAEGAMVPPAMRQEIWQIVFNDPLMQLITVEPTESPVVDLIGDETTPWGAAGVQARWRSEGSQLSASKLDTKPKQVRTHELYAFVLAPEELLEDAPRLNDRLNVKAPAAIRWKFIESLMFGTGAGQPLGWASANYSGKVAVARAVAAQFAPVDVAKMFSRLLASDGPDRSFWVTNRDTLPELVTRMVVGNSPVWLPPTGIQGAPGGSLLGRGVYFSEHCQTLGTEGDVQLVNPDGYFAIQRGQARNDSSIHLFFDYATTAFRWMFRFGGQPLLSAPVAAAKGANTKAHFIVLQ